MNPVVPTVLRKSLRAATPSYIVNKSLDMTGKTDLSLERQIHKLTDGTEFGIDGLNAEHVAKDDKAIKVEVFMLAAVLKCLSQL